MSVIGVVRPATDNRRSGARANCRASRTETTEPTSRVASSTRAARRGED